MSNASRLMGPLSAAGVSVSVSVSASGGVLLEVYPASALTYELRQHIREHKAELIALLQPSNAPVIEPITPRGDKERKLLSWLARIGETDPEAIGEVFDSCMNDPEAMAYYLSLANE